jgi:pimeloyl-ACP methyl ester carboxylesterase
VFVHGLFGDAASSWTNPSTGAYWPRLLLKADPAFQATNVYVYEYPTPLLGKTYSIDELAENLRLVLSNDRVFVDHREVVFLAHSMGGLVVRAFLSKYRDSAAKVAMVYFFATPTTGSAVTNVVRLLSRNPQLGQLLPMRSYDFLADVQRNWLAAKLGISSYCAYETRETFGVMVVDQASATSLCNMPLDPIDTDHIRIVKPADTRDVSYVVFRVAFRDSRSLAESRFSAPGSTPRAVPTIFMECKHSLLPTAMPSEGTVYFTVLAAMPAEPGHSGGLLRISGPAGGRMGWAADNTQGYRCEVVNYGPGPVFNVAMAFRLVFREAIRQGGDRVLSGKVTLSRDWNIGFNRVNPGGTFVFYVYNGSSHFVDALLPDSAILQVGGETQAQRVSITRQANPWIGLAPSPRTWGPGLEALPEKR